MSHEIQLGGADGLYYYGARFYDPYIAHFIQADTVIPEPGNSQSWDRYTYNYGNPVKYIDPDGHWPCFSTSSGPLCTFSTFGISTAVDRFGEKLGVKNGSQLASGAVSNVGLALDVVAEAADIVASAIVTSGIAVGATGGAAITLPGGGTAVATGGLGALVGWATAEIGVSPLILAGNILASAATGLNVGSEILSGETGFESTVGIFEEGVQMNGRLAIGSGSQVSTLATIAGWAAPLAYPSLGAQTAAVLGDLGVISPPPINLKWGKKDRLE